MKGLQAEGGQTHGSCVCRILEMLGNVTSQKGGSDDLHDVLSWGSQIHSLLPRTCAGSLAPGIDSKK